MVDFAYYASDRSLLWVHSGHHLSLSTQVQRYIQLKALISLICAAGVYVILGPILHVRMSFLFSVLTFLLNFIPVCRTVHVSTSVC